MEVLNLEMRGNFLCWMGHLKSCPILGITGVCGILFLFLGRGAVSWGRVGGTTGDLKMNPLLLLP